MTPMFLALAVFWLLCTGCGGGAESGAPEILFGEDVCDRCRMVISERRHAAGARLDGREYRFDDPGCLRTFLDSQSGRPATGIAWVHDETESWLAVEDAWFVVDPKHATPMASGILAFGTAAVAIAAGEQHGAEPVRWPDLRGDPR